MSLTFLASSGVTEPDVPERVLLDTNVFIHAIGSDQFLVDQSTHVLSAVADGKLDAVVSVETIQEIVNVLSRRNGDRAAAVRFASSVASANQLIGAIEQDVPDFLEFASRYSGIGARDALILAGAVNAGVSNVVTSDKRFADVSEVKVIRLSDKAAIQSLVEADA